MSFEIEKCGPISFVSLWQGRFAYSGALALAYEFQDGFVNFCKETSWDLGKDYTESVDQFRGCCCFNSLVFSFFFFFCLLAFLGLLLRHMEVPRLGVKSEL